MLGFLYKQRRETGFQMWKREKLDSLDSTGLPHYIALHFNVLHRCFVFYKLKARPSTGKKDYDSLYRDRRFIVVAWNRTRVSPKYACIMSVQAALLGQ